MVFCVALAVFVFAAWWKVFTKAGKPGGKGVGFGWGLAFLGFVFMPILAWGDAVYRPQR